ncbi:MAG: rod shape-determining protein MreC [Rickettsiales bacterium]|jgi:rod shape-determining protein MreC|nr:rod shape-determining protein MreC [Rickettsiales bacterium]
MRPIYRKKRGIGGFYWSFSYRIQKIIGELFYGLLILLSAFLIIHCRSQKSLEGRIRTLLLGQLGLFRFAARSVSMVLEECGARFVSLWSLDRRNRELLRENFDLRLKLFELGMIRSENSDLRELLNFTSQNRIGDYAIKKINIINAQGMTHSVQVSLDEVELARIAEQDLVLDRFGNLIGRVVNIAGNRAEILLVTDYRSRIPATLESSRLRVILGGNGSDLLTTEYFFNNGRDALDGENAYTANDGDILQEGILIGRVVGIGKNKKFAVKLNADLNLLDFVVIISRKSQ